MKVIRVAVLILCANIIFAAGFDAEQFSKLYDDYRLAPDNLMMMDNGVVTGILNTIQPVSNFLKIEQIGESVQGRPISQFVFGKGEKRLLLWSQMHGDEPTATAALLSIAKYLSENFEDPFVKKLYNELEIHAIIMLNPDGAQQFRRRNAMDIDINRDARLLQTPEGRLLKKMKDQIDPHFGFNLHDMGGRESVGDSRKVLKIALMAPPFNAADADTPSRIKAKQLALQIKSTLDLFIEGHVAKYDATYMPRAFGDAMQNWGVSTVLLESGRYQFDDPHELVRLNFVALLSAFNAIADNSIEKFDASKYDEIPLEGVNLFDLLLKDVTIINGTEPPFNGSLGINIYNSLVDGQVETQGLIKDIGDLMTTSGIRVIEEPDLVVTPGFIISNNFESFDRSDLHKLGITTVLTGIEIEKQVKMPGQMEFDQIKNMTSEIADRAGLKDRGEIKLNRRADLLIFQQKEVFPLELKNLKYVIQNGQLYLLK